MFRCYSDAFQSPKRSKIDPKLQKFLREAHFTSIGPNKPHHQILSVRASVKIIITFHCLASEGITSLWRGGSLNVEILI